MKYICCRCGEDVNGFTEVYFKSRLGAENREVKRGIVCKGCYREFVDVAKDFFIEREGK